MPENKMEATIKRKTAIEMLRERILAIKNNLPEGYRNILIKHHPKYNDMKGVTLLNNVIQLRSTDPELTAILEQIESGELK